MGLGQRGIIYVLTLASAMGLSGCFSQQDDSVVHKGGMIRRSQVEMKARMNGALQVIRTQAKSSGCLSCHGPTNFNFVASDADAMIARLDTVITSPDPKQSRLYVRSQKGESHSLKPNVDLIASGTGAAWIKAIQGYINARKVYTPGGPADFLNGVVEDQLSLRLTDRRAISSTLKQIFAGGNSRASAIADERITHRPREFGFGCDVYQRDEYCIWCPWHEGGVCRSGWVVRRDLASIPPSGIPLISRFALTTRACDMILGSTGYAGHSRDDAVRAVVGRVGGSVERLPSPTEIEKMWNEFYPGVTPSTEVTGALRGVAVETVTNSRGNYLDGWRFVLYTLCVSPYWHVL